MVYCVGGPLAFSSFNKWRKTMFTMSFKRHSFHMRKQGRGRRRGGGGGGGGGEEKEEGENRRGEIMSLSPCIPSPSP